MKIAELRIGSIIKGTKSEYCLVDEISEFRISGVHKDENGPVTSSFTSMQDIEPIKLTSEWLIKFGFKETKIENELVLQLDDISSLKAHPALLGCFVCDYIVKGEFAANKMSYIHQLQNLYFALTGEELSIKESA